MHGTDFEQHHGKRQTLEGAKGLGALGPVAPLVLAGVIAIARSTSGIARYAAGGAMLRRTRAASSGSARAASQQASRRSCGNPARQVKVAAMLTVAQSGRCPIRNSASDGPRHERRAVSG